MSDHEQEEIEQHNRKELARDAANHLRVAQQSIEQAQSALEDMGMSDYADQLQPLADACRKAADEVEEDRG